MIDPMIPPELHQIVVKLGQSGQTAFVVMATTLLEDELQKALTLKMPNLTKAIDKKLFEGNGTLATLSAKIDLAYVLGIIEKPIHQELHVVRKLRNAFAHPRGEVHFRVTAIRDLLSSLGGYSGEKDPYAFFGDKVRDLLGHLASKSSLGGLMVGSR